MTQAVPPLLLVHGIHAGGWVFERWIPRFRAAGLDPHPIDLRGHGSAPLPDGTRLGAVRFEDYVADAASAARPLGRPIVVGHSMGGLVAQALAERDLVAGAVLISPAPPRWISVLTLRLLRHQLGDLPTVLRGGSIRPNWTAASALALESVAEGERRALFDRFVDESGTVGRQLALTGVSVDAERVRCPMIVLSGDQDRLVPLSRARRIARRYRAPLEVLPGRGHMMMLEPGWEEGADLIVRWVQTSNAR